MIVMLNGSFGVGKTTVAEGLRNALPDSMIYDPEIVGMALRYLTEGVRTAEETTDDFQDIALWPTLVVTTAELLFRQYKRTLIIPMTLADPGHLDYIKTGLAKFEPVLYHFCLIASLETIHHRLHTRNEGDPAWPWRKAQQYVPLFNDQRYAIHLNTGDVTPGSIVQQIASYIANNPVGPRRQRT